MKQRLLGAALLLSGMLGCSTPDYVPMGPVSQPLTRFERIDPAVLKNGILKQDPPPAEAPPSPEAFLQSFRKDMVQRLRRKKLFDMPTGPMLALEGTLKRYDYESRKPSGRQDNNLFAGFVNVEVVLKDEKGMRIGGGLASVSGSGPTPDAAMTHAERRAVWAISDYLRRQVKKGPDKPEPDEP